MSGTIIMSVGGAGKNAVNQMIDSGLTGVEFTSADFWDLWQSKAPSKLELKSLYPGLTFPEFGNPARLRRQESALAEKDKIKEAVNSAKTLIIVAGIGGHTGAGVSPVIAKIARQCGVITAGVFMLPFGFEGESARRMAREALNESYNDLDMMMTVSPREFVAHDDTKVGIEDAFRLMDGVLGDAVRQVITFLHSRFPDTE